MIPISWWSRELFTRQKRIPAGYAEYFQPPFFLHTSNFNVHFYSQQTGLKENEHDPKVHHIIHQLKKKYKVTSDKSLSQNRRSKGMKFGQHHIESPEISKPILSFI